MLDRNHPRVCPSVSRGAVERLRPRSRETEEPPRQAVRARVLRFRGGRALPLMAGGDSTWRAAVFATPASGQATL